MENAIELGTYAGIMAAAIVLTTLVSSLFSVERRWLPAVTLGAALSLGVAAKFTGMYPDTDWITHALQLIAASLAANGTYNAVLKPASNAVKGGETAMLLLIGAAALSCVLLQGCSISQSQFVDTDGTWYKNTLIVPPFGKLDGEAAKMGYTWDGAGAGTVDVGRDTKGIDNTAQVSALQMLVGLYANKIAADKEIDLLKLENERLRDAAQTE